MSKEIKKIEDLDWDNHPQSEANRNRREAIKAIKRYQELYSTGDVGRMLSSEAKEYHNSNTKKTFSDWFLDKIILLLESATRTADKSEPGEFINKCRELRKKGATDEQWEYASLLMESCDRLEAETTNSREAIKVLEYNLENSDDLIEDVPVAIKTQYLALQLTIAQALKILESPTRTAEKPEPGEFTQVTRGILEDEGGNDEPERIDRMRAKNKDLKEQVKALEALAAGGGRMTLAKDKEIAQLQAANRNLQEELKAAELEIKRMKQEFVKHWQHWIECPVYVTEHQKDSEETCNCGLKQALKGGG